MLVEILDYGYIANDCGKTCVQMKQTTIVDIATKLGVSPSTVSRALSDHPDVKQATKNLVRKTAVENNYTPNPIARSLRNSRTTTIGVIVPEIKHDFFSSAISGVEDVAYRAGYTILVCQSNESHEREVVNTHLLLNHRVAGVVVSVAQDSKGGDHFREVLKRKVPLVFFDRAAKDIAASKVVIDDLKLAHDAVRYLVGKGYKRIAHFGGPQALGICRQRLDGYMTALSESGMPVTESIVRFGGMHEQDGYAAMDTLLSENNIPDAIFAVNDPVVIGAFQRIKEAGLRIPDDIALVGFSNNKITSLVDPQITTVDQPSFEMGRKAAAILIDTIEGRLTEPTTFVVDAKLIVRGST